MHLRASRGGFEFFSVEPEKNRRPGCTPQGEVGDEIAEQSRVRGRGILKKSL